jgi:hypothetical protein
MGLCDRQPLSGINRCRADLVVQAYKVALEEDANLLDQGLQGKLFCIDQERPTTYGD